MDIKSTMCRISDLTPDQVDSLRAAMPDSDAFDFGRNEFFIGVTAIGTSGTWVDAGESTIVSYDEMMQLLTGKDMGFTKQDLIKLAETESVFVRYRKGDYRIYLDGIFNGENWVSIDDFNEDLNCSNNSRLDVMSVYTCNPRQALLGQLEGIGLTQVWERTELTPAQQEMEVLQAKMDKFQAKMDELQEQMKVAKAKLYLQGDWGE
jgi:hypothetical protein